jgi:CBS domain containing-hemolysin-like protein
MSDTASARPESEEKPESLLKRFVQFLRGDSAAAIHESLEAAIEQSDRQSTALSAPEQTILTNLMRFGDLKVSDVMVPRAEILAIEEQTSIVDLIGIFREAQHSRLPVYRETLDDPIGLIHIKDVIGLVDAQADGSFRWRDMPLAKIIRELLFVPPSMPLLDLLLKMQTAHTHLALVIDEYGGTDGLVSIEDVIEEIVGDIADEHDEEAPHARKAEDGSFIADARMDLEDFKQDTGISLATEYPAEDVDTVGGLVIALLGRVPQRGEIVDHPGGFEFEVLEADPRRVKRVRVRRSARGPAQETDVPAG